MSFAATLTNPPENTYSPYQIYEGDSGLQISQSRVLLFDVMEAYDEGDSIYQICETFNMTPLQVKTAIAFIDHNRAVLKPEFDKAVQLRKEREAYHRRLLAERLAKTPPLPMTPERAAAYALLGKNRMLRNGDDNADYSE